MGVALNLAEDEVQIHGETRELMMTKDGLPAIRLYQRDGTTTRERNEHVGDQEVDERRTG